MPAEDHIPRHHRQFWNLKLTMVKEQISPAIPMVSCISYSSSYGVLLHFPYAASLDDGAGHAIILRESALVFRRLLPVKRKQGPHCRCRGRLRPGVVHDEAARLRTRAQRATQGEARTASSHLSDVASGRDPCGVMHPSESEEIKGDSICTRTDDEATSREAELLALDEEIGPSDSVSVAWGTPRTPAPRGYGRTSDGSDYERATVRPGGIIRLLLHSLRSFLSMKWLSERFLTRGRFVPHDVKMGWRSIHTPEGHMLLYHGLTGETCWAEAVSPAVARTAHQHALADDSSQDSRPCLLPPSTVEFEHAIIEI